MLNQKMKLISKVPFVDLSRQYKHLREEILTAIDNVLTSGQYILGKYVEQFENEMASFLGCRHVLGVANGTDALIIVLKCLDIKSGDEVIVPVNSFLATAGAVAAVGAKPILCDVGYDLNIDPAKIENLISPRTKAIIPVHLTGSPADMDPILSLADKYALSVIEDAAQSIGAKYKNKMTGSIGDAGCFSLHPLKNLRVYGDGGIIVTNNEKLYEAMKLMRNHGLINRDVCTRWGLNSRLDSIHAAVASVGLRYLTLWNERRRLIANKYIHSLGDFLKCPVENKNNISVFHNFVALCNQRNELMRYLNDEKGIETKIHYPIQIHQQPAAHALGYQVGDFPIAEECAEKMLSLPVYAELLDEEQDYIIESIQSFFN